MIFKELNYFYSTTVDLRIWIQGKKCKTNSFSQMFKSMNLAFTLFLYLISLIKNVAVRQISNYYLAS